MKQHNTLFANRVKKSNKISKELANTLVLMNELIENFSIGSSLKYIENVSYLSSITSLENSTQKYFISHIISMILHETLMESGNFEFLMQHRNCIFKLQIALSEYLSKACKKVLGKKMDSALKSLITSNHDIVLKSAQSLPDASRMKLRMLTKIHEHHKSTSFSWTLLALQNVIESQIESSIFPVYTKKLDPFLPETEKNFHTLVMDLDETLIHRDGQEVLIRPGAQEFLEEMGKVCEIVIFTCAMQVYADYAMKKIDPGDKVKLRLYRQHVSRDGLGPFKDLQRLGRNLEKVVIVDNLEQNFRHQPSNGICIETWTGEPGDTELLTLCQDLKLRFQPTP